MGLLSKSNLKATWRSVVVHAVVGAASGSALYGAILWWNQWLDDWPIKISICAVLVGLVAALCEWQIPADDGLDDIMSYPR